MVLGDSAQKILNEKSRSCGSTQDVTKTDNTIMSSFFILQLYSDSSLPNSGIYKELFNIPFLASFFQLTDLPVYKQAYS